VATSTNKKGMTPAQKKGAIKDATLIAGLVLTPLYKQPQMVQGLVKVVQGAGQAGPAPALAHAIFALISKARNMLIQQKLPVDPRAWLAPGGAIDKIIIDIGGLLSSVLGPQFLDKTFGQNVKKEIIKIMHQEKSAAIASAQPQDDESAEPAPDDEAAEGEAGPPQAGGLIAGGMQ
jgi:hypothetical protein